MSTEHPGTMKRQCLRKVPGFGLQLASDIHLINRACIGNYSCFGHFLREWQTTCLAAYKDTRYTHRRREGVLRHFRIHTVSDKGTPHAAQRTTHNATRELRMAYRAKKKGLDLGWLFLFGLVAWAGSLIHSAKTASTAPYCSLLLLRMLCCRGLLSVLVGSQG